MGGLGISTNHVGIEGLPLGRYVSAGLFAPIQRVHLQTEALVTRGPLNLILPASCVHISLDQLKNEATP